MELRNKWSAPNRGMIARLLEWVNLRPEESDRTWLMFAFYTFTSVGLRWSEDSTVALFLDEYGAKYLPLIYLASSLLGGILVSLYSRLQRIFPLRWVIVAIAPCMFLPLLLLRLGLQVPFLSVITIFLLRLWVDAFYVVNDLNTSIAANQLFNIREIKRAYPLISSGILVADVISGFSLPLLLLFVGLDMVIMPTAGIFIGIGAIILWYVSHKYPQAFPSIPQKYKEIGTPSPTQRLSGSLKRYTWLLFAFFALLQAMGVLIDFQYLSQVESNFQGKDIASFLGILGGITGICELGTQLFFSSRALERFGVFRTAATLPLTVFALMLPLLALDIFFFSHPQYLLFGLVTLKILDELLRYTFVLSSGPLLFQPIPDKVRTYVQALSGGIADNFGVGMAGLAILGTLTLSSRFLSLSLHRSLMEIETIIIAITCLIVIYLLRSHYVNLLVVSAGSGQLNSTDVDLRAFKQVVIKTLTDRGNEGDKRSCIELLSQIDPQGSTEVLAPLLDKLSPSLQKASLEAMLTTGANHLYIPNIQTLLQAPQGVHPEVFALALRYVWLAEPDADVGKLEKYLEDSHYSIIQATAAALLLRQGTPMQKVAATKTLRRLLTHEQERERVNAVKALREAVYLQALRVHIPNLLQDESLRVRCAVLQMIAATNLEEYYPALLAGLYYKSTRSTAMKALVELSNEALPLLLDVATNVYKPEVVRMYAWRTIGQIPTLEAIDILWEHLENSEDANRSHILRTLLKRHQQETIVGLLDRFHEIQVKRLIQQELEFLGHIYAAYIDFTVTNELDNLQHPQKFHLVCNLLQRALLELESDLQERLLLLLQLIYPSDKIQAASSNLRSQSTKNFARGLEILEHTLNLPNKSAIITVLDRRSPYEKLQKLTEKDILEYQPLEIGDRTRKLLQYRTLLSHWSWACCLHLAEVVPIRLDTEQVIDSLRHPTGFVREAAISYLKVASPRILWKILPQMQNDPHPLVANQVQQLLSNS
ncbi:hypothetical protein [Calothrix sp. 336/3]|uniref:hypothetical protein n=1 Tax=Calothrix sp. 336/3 TaxID=1337936 RepID=UPI0004E307EA|nr:hypothetical protein [Calothrix sp. 336/3]AKG23765.1 hypothetical protein IJ00_22930 [Calothrix sp. 336/3]